MNSENPPCELCGRESTAVDRAVPDVTGPDKDGFHCVFHYRDQYLCAVHARERKQSNLARIEDLASLV